MSSASTTFPDNRKTATLDSLTLLERIAAGDHDAVSECITRYGDLIWYLAKKFSASNADAEDATQEIFLELWQKAIVFDRGLSSEETFIAMVARRRLIDRRRRANATVETVAFESEQFEPADELSMDPVELRDEAAKAAACMEKLSTDQRSVLTMSIQQGLPHSSISNCLKMPLGTVKSFARRGLLQLRDCMNRNSLVHAGSRPL
jgi:RNA polymerase sigma-70 factor (ECF subfamily)